MSSLRPRFFRCHIIYLVYLLAVVITYFVLRYAGNLHHNHNSFWNSNRSRGSSSSAKTRGNLGFSKNLLERHQSTNEETTLLNLNEEEDQDHGHDQDVPLACPIPNLIPNSKDAMKLNRAEFNTLGYTPPCINNKVTKFKMDYGSKLVRLRKDDSFWKIARCCYHSFWRLDTKPDFQLAITPRCYSITKNVTLLPKEHQFILITCTHKILNTTIYEDQLGHFILQTPVEDRAESFKNGDADKLSIVIFGMDSISRMNFQRYMPKAHKYLTDVMEAIEFKGFTSLGAGVRENIFPMLSGMTFDIFRQTCWPFDQWFMNECPFIWNQPSKPVYRTSFQEDDMQNSIFKDSLSPGFAGNPFDYDLRVLTLAMDNVKVGHNALETRFQECYGSRLQFKYLLDNLLLLHDVLKSKVQFHFTWTKSLTKTINEFAKFGDQPLLETLEELVRRKSLNNTAFIVMSNQGMQYGALREKSEQGFLEQRLPLLYVVLPKWFKRKYKRATRNLQRNSKMMTTALDLHEMLLQLTDLRSIEDKAILQSPRRGSQKKKGSNDHVDNDSIRGISLFSSIPSNRTCESAQINDLFCICLLKINVPVNESVVIQATSFILSEMNKKLFLFPVCSPLKLDKIQSAHLLKDQKSVVGPVTPSLKVVPVLSRTEVGNPITNVTTTGKRRISETKYKSTSTPIPRNSRTPITTGIETHNLHPGLLNQIQGDRDFEITFTTLPGGAVFEATIKNVQVRIKNHENMFILGDVNRIGDYRSSIKCSPTIKIRPMCVC